MDLNEGIRLLTGAAKIVLPLKKKPAPAPPEAAAGGRPPLSGSVTTTCVVEEDGRRRAFRITIEPPQGPVAEAGAVAPPATGGSETQVYSPFQGKVQVVRIDVKVGDTVAKGQVVAAVEAMKATHDVKAPCDGKVAAVLATIGDDIAAGQPILTIGS
jgi:pyruvate carboxylase subunit B